MAEIRPMTRGEVIAELDRLGTRLRDVAFGLRRLADNIAGDARHRPKTRDYDMPPPDPQEVMEKYGVEDHTDEGEPPEWFTQKHRPAGHGESWGDDV